MKNKFIFTFVFTLVSTSFLLINPTSAKAVDVNLVGNESYTINWNTIPSSDNGDNYQVFFGQTNTGRKDTAIGGFDNRSHEVTLNNLKPCTSYSWDLYSSKSGVWNKVLANQTFNTGGTCQTPTVIAPAGASMVNAVAAQTTVTGNKTGSSTIGWSTYPQASEYRIYYRPSWETKYVYSVVVPGNGNSVTINSLQPGATYYYKVAAVVNGVEYWYAEKTLQLATGIKPVLGAQTNTRYTNLTQSVKGLMTTNNDVKGAMTCSNNGTASISIRTPGGVNVDRVHILYGNQPGKYVHALRDLQQSAHEVSIGALDTCTTYYYQVQVVGTDGRTYWQGEMMMNITQ